MYFSCVIPVHSILVSLASQVMVRRPSAVWEEDAQLGLWARAVSVRVTWTRGLQPPELQRHGEYGAVTSQTAQEGEQLTGSIREGPPARGPGGVGVFPPAHLAISFLLCGSSYLPPSHLAHALRSRAPFAFQIPLVRRLRCSTLAASVARAAVWTGGLCSLQ